MKRIAFNISTLLLGLFLLTFVGCSPEDIEKDNKKLFKKMVKELGKEGPISNISSISYSSTGLASEFQEDPEPVGGKVADFSYDLIYTLDGLNSKQSWSIQTDYAYESDFSFVETMDGIYGKSVGNTGFFSVEFAAFGVMGDPMFSTKLAARQKTLFMSNPLAMVKMILDVNEYSGPAFGVVTSGFNLSDLGFGPGTPDIMLVIDEDSELPLAAIVMENDPLYGDVLYEVRYSNWTEVDDIKVPQTLEHVLDGNTIRTETLSSIVLNPTYSAADLTVDAADAWPYSSTEASAGHLSSQFHFRTLMQTFAIDFPVEFTDATSPLALPSEEVVGDANVFRVSGDFQSHYTYAFKVNGELVLYDSPVNNRRSAAVLNKVRSDFSTDPIRHVVNSHNHFDHIGGFRGNLAEGGDLIVGSGSVAEMTSILLRDHTVLPDPLAGISVNVVGVMDSMIIGSGSDQLIVYTVTTEHAETHDFLLIYKPSTQTIYSNDLYNPGFINIFPTTTTDNQIRLKALAQDLVDFVDGRGLSVSTSYCSHGFTTLDFDFANVRALAAM